MFLPRNKKLSETFICFDLPNRLWNSFLLKPHWAVTWCLFYWIKSLNIFFGTHILRTYVSARRRLQSEPSILKRRSTFKLVWGCENVRLKELLPGSAKRIKLHIFMTIWRKKKSSDIGSLGILIFSSNTGTLPWFVPQMWCVLSLMSYTKLNHFKFLITWSNK